MIAEREQYAVTSTVPQDSKVTMGVAAEDMGHIMDLLTDAYSDRRLACLREYSTNARDAQVEAGVQRPIEVSLPTALTPFLTIKDYGVGLSEQDIREVYAMYGKSTKRGSNEFNGTLGIGCKSALAYTTQFTVTSVKDGVRTVVVVSRDEDGGGSMIPMEAGLTTDAPGTEVRIPVNRADFHYFTQIAASLFKFWPEGSVLVDGAAPKPFKGLLIHDSADLSVYVSDGSEGSRIVMGGVPYPAPQIDSLCPTSHVVAFVGIGAVSFPPSREALKDTKQTRATIERITKAYEAGVKDAIQREVNNASDPRGAIRAAAESSRKLFGKVRFEGLTFKGQPLPLRVEAATHIKGTGGGVYGPSFIVSQTQGYGRLGASNTHPQISGVELTSTVWVENFSPAKYSALHKRKMNRAMEGVEGFKVGKMPTYGNPDASLFYVEQYVCLPGKIDRTDPAFAFVPDSAILDWDVVRKIQLQERAGRTQYGRIPGSYDCITEDGYKHGIPGDQLRRDVPLMYFRGNRWAFSRYEDPCKQNFPKFTVVLLSENRVGKWTRTVPESKTVQAALNEAATKWAKSLSDDARKALAMSSAGFRPTLASMSESMVQDPVLAEAIRVAKVNTKAAETRKAAFEKYARIDLGVVVRNPLANYPLYPGKPSPHAYWYLNTVHADGAEKVGL